MESICETCYRDYRSCMEPKTKANKCKAWKPANPMSTRPDVDRWNYGYIHKPHMICNDRDVVALESYTDQLQQENDQLRRDGHALALETHELEIQLTALKAENDKGKELLELATNALEWWDSNYPEGAGKEDQDVIEKFNSFLKGAQDE